MRCTDQSVQRYQQVEGACPAPSIRLKVPIECEDISGVQLISELY